MSKDRTDLIELKKQVIENIAPLVDKGDMSAKDKFGLILQMAEASGSSDSYKKAFDLVSQLESDQDKTSAYLDLLGSIEAELHDVDGELSDDYSESEDQ